MAINSTTVDTCSVRYPGDDYPDPLGIQQRLADLVRQPLNEITLSHWSDIFWESYLIEGFEWEYLSGPKGNARKDIKSLLENIVIEKQTIFVIKQGEAHKEVLKL